MKQGLCQTKFPPYFMGFFGYFFVLFFRNIFLFKNTSNDEFF